MEEYVEIFNDLELVFGYLSNILTDLLSVGIKLETCLGNVEKLPIKTRPVKLVKVQTKSTIEMDKEILTKIRKVDRKLKLRDINQAFDIAWLLQKRAKLIETLVDQSQFCMPSVESTFLEQTIREGTILPQIMVDITMQNFRDIQFISSTNQIVNVDKKQVTIKLPITNQEKIDFPIMKYDGEYQTKSIDKYWIEKGQDIRFYSHAPQSRLLFKIIHDNNIKFQLNDYNTCYYDIETYNETQYNEVPLFENSYSHISMISLIIVPKKGEIIKYCLVVDNKSQLFSSVDVTIKVRKFPKEQDICREFFRLISDLKTVIFLIGFKSSSNLFADTHIGYDLPFIINRSNLILTTQKCRVKIVGLQTESYQINKITQFPLIYPIDMQVIMRQTLSSDEKCNMPKYALKNYLDLYNIPQKLDIGSYKELQEKCSIKGADISQIINYCVYDSECLHLINQKKGLIVQKLAQMAILKQPLSSILYKTTVNNITNHLQQQFVNAGYLVQYGVDQDKEQSSFKGAYTATICQSNKVFNDVIPLDFASFYPNSIIAANISLETLNQPGYIVDVSDDENAIVKQYEFGNTQQGIIPKFCQLMFEMRKEYKKRAESDLSDIFANNMQLQYKLMNNSMYGLLGQKTGLLYYPALAMSCTAQCRTVIKATEQWMTEQQYRVLFMDTDSCFAQIPEQINNGQQLSTSVMNLNQYLADKFSARFVLDYECLIKNISFIDGRKSYICHKSNKLDVSKWERDTQYDLKFCAKGFNPSLQSSYSKDLFYTVCNYFLTNGPDAQAYFLQIVAEQRQLIDEVCDSGNVDRLISMTKKMKVSGKSLFCKQLQTFNLDEEYVHVAKLNGSKQMLASSLVHPVQLLTAKQIKERVDRAYLLEKLISDIGKFLLCKTDKRLGKFKSDRDDLFTHQKDGDLFIRKESLTKGGHVRNEQILMHIDNLFNYTRKHSETSSLHEVITQNNIRLFFDIDHEDCDILHVCDIISKILVKFTNQTVEFVNLMSSGIKQTWHIYTNMQCSLETARIIGNLINDYIQYQIIDTSVYFLYKSLRIPNTGKMDRQKCEILNRQYQITDESMFKRCFIQNLDNCHAIKLPFHYQNKIPLDAEYTSQQQHEYTDKHQKILGNWLLSNNIIADLVKDNDKIQIRKHISYVCPIHQKTHDSENLYAKLYKNKIVVYCYRSSKEEKKLQNIQLSMDETSLVAMSNIERHINNQQPSSILSESVQQNNQYFKDQDIGTSRIIYIQSALGTGKTRYLETVLQSGIYQRILILSHRRTFTQDMVRKYGCVSYIDIVGTISLTDHKCVIVQLESLHRVQDLPDLLIIDEIESNLSQLNGGISNLQNAQQKFLEVVKNAPKIIVCDGFLQQATIDMMNYFIDDDSQEIHQNQYQPYTNRHINIIPFTSNNNCQYIVLRQMLESLQNGKKLVGMITSNKMATFLSDMIASYGFRVKCYTGDDSKQLENGDSQYKQKHDDFVDIKNNWQQCDILLYTSTLTAGCDFSEQYFDEFIHVYCKNTCDPLSLIQGIARVRKFNDQQHTIYFQEQFGGDLIMPNIRLRLEDYHIIDNDKLEQFKLYLQSRDAALQYYRTNIVVQCLYKLGYNIKYMTIEFPKIPKQDSEFEFVPITWQHLELYDRINRNKDVLLTITLPDNYNTIERQIRNYLSCKINPKQIVSERYNNGGFYQHMMSYQTQIQASQKSSKIGDSHASMLQHIAEDKMFRKSDNCATKQIDYLTLKKQLDYKVKGEQLWEFFKGCVIFEGDGVATFMKSDLVTFYDTTNKNWIGQLQHHINAMGYVMNKTSKRSGNEREYIFRINPISNILQ